MFSRNSPIQILHRLTSVYTLLAVLTTYFLPAFAQSISALDFHPHCATKPLTPQKTNSLK